MYTEDMPKKNKKKEKTVMIRVYKVRAKKLLKKASEKEISIADLIEEICQ